MSDTLTDQVNGFFTPQSMCMSTFYCILIVKWTTNCYVYKANKIQPRRSTVVQYWTHCNLEFVCTGLLGTCTNKYTVFSIYRSRTHWIERVVKQWVSEYCIFSINAKIDWWFAKQKCSNSRGWSLRTSGWSLRTAPWPGWSPSWPPRPHLEQHQHHHLHHQQQQQQPNRHWPRAPPPRAAQVSGRDFELREREREGVSLLFQTIPQDYYYLSKDFTIDVGCFKIFFHLTKDVPLTNEKILPMLSLFTESSALGIMSRHVFISSLTHLCNFMRLGTCCMIIIVPNLHWTIFYVHTFKMRHLLFLQNNLLSASPMSPVSL